MQRISPINGNWVTKMIWAYKTHYWSESLLHSTLNVKKLEGFSLACHLLTRSKSPESSMEISSDIYYPILLMSERFRLQRDETQFLDSLLKDNVLADEFGLSWSYRKFTEISEEQDLNFRRRIIICNLIKDVIYRGNVLMPNIDWSSAAPANWLRISLNEKFDPPTEFQFLIDSCSRTLQVDYILI